MDRAPRSAFAAHDSVWRAPAPLWPTLAAAEAPQLLRFAGDDFMDRLLALLAAPAPAATPGQAATLASVDAARSDALAALLAQAETWRDGAPTMPQAVAAAPLAARLQSRLAAGSSARLAARLNRGRPAVAASTPSTPPPAASTRRLKLFQPAHQRHYLVTASLVCQLPGLPDRRIDGGHQEVAGFVLRRLLPADALAAALDKAGQAFRPDQPGAAQSAGAVDEYAFSSAAQAGWRRCADPLQPLADEELLPMFPLGYTQADGRARRLLAGTVPVARREAYLGAPEASAAAAPTGPADDGDPRLTLLRKTVTGPWRQLVEQAQAFANGAEQDKAFKEQTDAQKAAARRALRDQLQVGSWYVLADLAAFLQAELPALWQRLSGASASLSAAEQAVFDSLAAATLDDATLRGELALPALDLPGQAHQPAIDPLHTLAQALTLVVQPTTASQLDSAATPFSATLGRAAWPGWLFPLVDCSRPAAAPLPLPAAARAGLGTLAPDRLRFAALNDLLQRVQGALPPLPASRPRIDTIQAPARPEVEAWFVIRCVYRRPACEDLHAAVVSRPTLPFQLAAYFDPDAPARAIRIGLPIDTSPGGLRKFDKNTAFIMSDMLCGQVQRAKGLGLVDLVRSVLPFPLHKDLDVGDMQACSKANGDSLQLGMICSLSIPIITLCALILLLIMVSLLDIIFRWMPWFAVCFPILKRKTP